jgi:hypothetical protein
MRDRRGRPKSIGYRPHIGQHLGIRTPDRSLCAYRLHRQSWPSEFLSLLPELVPAAKAVQANGGRSVSASPVRPSTASYYCSARPSGFPGGGPNTVKSVATSPRLAGVQRGHTNRQWPRPRYQTTNMRPCLQPSRLTRSSRTGQAIEQAKGILMSIYGIDSEHAFHLLRARTRDSQVKLRLLAAQVVRDVVALTPSNGLTCRRRAKICCSLRTSGSGVPRTIRNALGGLLARGCGQRSVGSVAIRRLIWSTNCSMNGWLSGAARTLAIYGPMTARASTYMVTTTSSRKPAITTTCAVVHLPPGSPAGISSPPMYGRARPHSVPSQ